VLREYRIQDLPVRSISDATVPGGPKRAAVEYQVPSGGTLRLTFTAHRSNENKIDLEILDFHYLSPMSRLALQVRLHGSGNWTIENTADLQRLVFPGQDTS